MTQTPSASSRPRFWGALLVLLFAGAGFFWTGCDVGAVDDNLKLIVDYSPANTTVTGQVLDASTEAPIEGESITVRFSGPDAGRVVDIAGEVLTEMTVPDISLLNFNLDGAEPSTDDPAEIKLHVSAPGYIATSERLIIDRPDYSFSTSLTSVSNPPSGVEATVQTFATSGGAPTQDVTVRTDAEDNTGARATLSIPEGTVMRTDDGTPLSGDVSATVAYYSNQNDKSLAAFPGGFMGVNIDENEGGGGAVGSFITAGFAAIEVVDQQGRKARQFDGPIDISIDVPQGTLNPETGQPVQSGDEIPVYSFDDETGEWTFEGRTEANMASSSASAKSNGGLGVAFQTQHLTYWNLDWFWGDRCRLAGRQLFEGMPQNSTDWYRWVLRDARTGYYFKSGYHYRGNFLRFWNAPRNMPMRFELIDLESRTTVAEGRIADLCVDKTWNVSVPPRPNRVTVDVNATIVCEADQEIRPSNYVTYYYSPTARHWGYARMKHGQATLRDLREGATYRFWIWMKGRWEWRQVTIEPGTVEDGVTVTRTGASTYRVDVNYDDRDGAVC